MRKRYPRVPVKQWRYIPPPPLLFLASSPAARANLSSVVAAMVAVLVGLAGNVICNLNYVRYFALYFLVCLGIVFVMLYVC